MSLRSRLVVAAAYLLVVMAITLAVPLAVNIERRQISEFQSGVLGNAALLASSIADQVRPFARLSSVQRADLDDEVEETAQRIDARVVVVDGDGRALADSAGRNGAAPGERYATAERPEFGSPLGEGTIDSRRRFSESLGEELLLVTVPVANRGTVVGAVRVSQKIGVVERNVRQSWLGLGLIGAVVVIAGVILAWILATSLVRPIRRLEAAATQLGEGDLSARAEPGGPPEVATLAQSFNTMADGLAANLEAQRDFLANASHQLRTPLTGLRLRLEAIEDEGGPASEQAIKAERELDRLNELVEALLQLARASSAEVRGTAVDLRAAAQQAVERWTGPATQKGVRVAIRDGGAATAWSDSTDIAHVLDNLIENAIRYSPEGAEVTVSTLQRDGASSVIVADTGPGIPKEEGSRIFERFYRGSAGRRAGPGTGLGLAVVAELARRWGGEVRLLEGAGTRIEATFRRAPTVS